MSFPTLFIRSLVEVYRSSAKFHGLFFPIFIHRILLHLGLEDFPTSKPVHIIGPIGATFLRQRAAQMKASSTRPRVESSTSASMPPTSVDPIVEEYVDPTAAVDPPPSSSSDASIWSMLDTVSHDCPLAIRHKKEKYLCVWRWGEFFGFYRLYLGAS